MDKNNREYLIDAILDMVENKVSVHLTFEKSKYSGFFEDEDQSLTCFLNKDPDWFTTFVHEYNHFCQNKEGKYFSKIYMDAIVIVDEILKGKKYDNDITLDAFGKVRRLELDCEKRSVDHINKYNLYIPGGVDRYIKQANVYVFSYTAMIETKQWPKKSVAKIEELIDIMPTKFLSRYDRLPKKYMELLLKHCY